MGRHCGACLPGVWDHTLYDTVQQKVNFASKIVLGIANLYIAVAFFAMYGTEAIQKFFALPLYILVGVLFIYEGIKNREDILQKPTKIQTILLVLYVAYPAISLLFGNSFPRMVTFIMPCPIISLSIAVYAGYKKKNKLLLVLLTIWGLTGIKSLLFSAYEDLILLLCGIYGIALLIQEIQIRKYDGMKRNR